jgi:N-acetylneuraminic acid mutarotase
MLVKVMVSDGLFRNQGQISHRIEWFNEGSQLWSVLTVELPFSLEGLSSVMLSDEELLIIGGKGIEGSRKEVIYYNSKELEQDTNTSGSERILKFFRKVIGSMQHPRSLPKPMLLGNGRPYHRRAVC